MIRATMCTTLLVAAGIAVAWPTAARAQATEDLADARAPYLRSRFYIRAGGALIKPVSSSRELELADVDGAASLAVQNGPVEGSGARVGSAITAAAIVGYVLPTASQRWSIEGVIGLPFTVKFEATGTLATMSLAPTALGIPTGVGPLGPELGEATALPLVLTVTYRPLRSRVFWPYVGAGPSVLFARNAKVTNSILTEVNQPEMTIDPAPGLVLQGGLEARLTRSIYARIDVKFIALMRATAEVRHINVRTPGLPLFDSVEVGTAKMTVDVNPFVVHAGVGFDFDLW
jgi:outer membrane protein W